ncbi:hypothetical protein [Streptomyces sp. NPDC001054]
MVHRAAGMPHHVQVWVCYSDDDTIVLVVNDKTAAEAAWVQAAAEAARQRWGVSAEAAAQLAAAAHTK